MVYQSCHESVYLLMGGMRWVYLQEAEIQIRVGFDDVISVCIKSYVSP